MTDEKKLLRQLQNKEKNSINKAIETYTPYLSVVLYNAVGNKLQKEDIEEIISDVFVMLWKNAERIDLKKGTIRSYIAATARNFALKRLTKQKDVISLDNDEIKDEREFAESNSDICFIWDTVMRLGEPDSEIFVRYYKFGEKIKEISKATGINVSTVKTKLSRGKIKLKKMLSNAEGQE